MIQTHHRTNSNRTYKDSSCIRYFNDNDHIQSLLFCFHYAGGNAGIFSTWHHTLPSYIAICGIQLPGRSNLTHLTPHTDISTVVSYLQQEMAPHFTNKPYSFFGYSIGALIAFELARKIQQDQQKMPDKLIVAACKSPNVSKHQEKISHLPEEEIINKLSKYNGTPLEVLENKELMQLLLPMIRADFAMNENYHYSTSLPLRCPITTYGGAQDPTIAAEDLTGWQAETSKEFKLHMLPGDHFFINHHRQEFLTLLNRELNNSSKSS
jgi:medium-chain acyl-[acyl-carrier-protein] hydrolase